MHYYYLLESQPGRRVAMDKVSGHLLDQNNFHVESLQGAGYKPSISAIILAGMGITAMYVPPPPPLPSYLNSLPDQSSAPPNLDSGKNCSLELKPRTVSRSSRPQNSSRPSHQASNRLHRSTSSGHPYGQARRLTAGNQSGNNPITAAIEEARPVWYQ